MFSKKFPKGNRQTGDSKMRPLPKCAKNYHGLLICAACILAFIMLAGIAWIIAGLAAVAGGYTLWTFNRLVGLRNQLREAWSGVDVQLKRRHDLIPNLVECVKGYRTHEQNVLESVTRERGHAQSAQGVAGVSAAENGLSQNLRALFAVAEAYPELKADQNFRQLSATLVDVENDIQFARRYYNGSVRDLNNLIQSFPSLLVARGFNFVAAEFFEIETATERNAPEVKI